MIRLFLSFLLAVLLVMRAPLSETSAQTYRYTGNMPAAKMTLDMMEVLGYIQRVPDSPYGGGMSYSWPLSNMMSPMSSPGGLPLSAGMMAMQNPWSGMSSWPGMAVGNTPSLPQMAPQGSQPGNGSIQVKPSDLAALLSAVQRPAAPVAPVPEVPNYPPPMAAPPVEATPSSVSAAPSAESAALSLDNRGSVVGDLSGVWRGNNQDVLVVTGRRFIWTDKDAKTIEGEMVVQGDKLLTRLSSNGSVMTYRFKSEGDRFVAVTETGYQYIFQRAK